MTASPRAILSPVISCLGDRENYVNFANAARSFLAEFVGRPLRDGSACRAVMEAGMLHLLVKHNIRLDDSGMTIRSDLGSININQEMVDEAAGRKTCKPVKTEGVLSPEKPMFTTRNEVLKYLENVGELETPAVVEHGFFAKKNGEPPRLVTPRIRYRWDAKDGPVALAEGQAVWNMTKLSCDPKRFEVAPRRFGPWVEVKTRAEAADCGTNDAGERLNAAVYIIAATGAWYQESVAGRDIFLHHGIWVKYEPETK